MEKWIVHPGETRVIDVDGLRELKIGLVGGQVDVIAHDDPGARIEVHGVTVKDLRIEMNDGRLEIDHPQLRWDNFLEVFRNFGAGGPKAEVSVAVPRNVALTLGVVSASGLSACAKCAAGSYQSGGGVSSCDTCGSEKHTCTITGTTWYHNKRLSKET